MDIMKKIAALFIVLLVSTTVTVSAAKPERPDPLDAVWDAITNLQTQASWLWGNITQLKNTDSTLQEHIDTKQSSAPDYDSGWIDIRGMAGAEILINHNLDTTDPRVYITGKTTADGGVHQRYLGLVNAGTYEFKTFDGSNGWDRGYSLVQTSDGGYAILGDTYTLETGQDAWLIKIDADGNHQWNQTYGMPYSHDTGLSLVQTSDGGYAITGVTQGSWETIDDVWLIKTDMDGNLEWSQTFDGSNGWDRGLSLVQTSDGGYAILGDTYTLETGQDAWLIKTDADGNHQWNQTFGGPNDDSGRSLVQTSDDEYVITGWTRADGAVYSDVWLIKTDADGNLEWSQTFGGPNDDWGYSLVQTSDGGYTITGCTSYLMKDTEDVLLIKTDADGNQVWNQTFGGSSYETGYSVVQTSDGGYYITGDTGSYGAGASDVWLIKTDADGNQVWNQTFGGSGYETGYSLVQTSDGGYYITGWAESYEAGTGDVLLIKFDPNGESGLAWIDSTENSVTLYRGFVDTYWNYVRVQIWTLD